MRGHSEPSVATSDVTSSSESREVAAFVLSRFLSEQRNHDPTAEAGNSSPTPQSSINVAEVQPCPSSPGAEAIAEKDATTDEGDWNQQPENASQVPSQAMKAADRGCVILLCQVLR